MWTIRKTALNNWTSCVIPADLTNAVDVEALDSLGQTRRTQKRSVEPREIVNGLMYVASTDASGVDVPKTLPPKSTLFWLFRPLDWEGTRIAFITALREVSRRHGS